MEYVKKSQAKKKDAISVKEYNKINAETAQWAIFIPLKRVLPQTWHEPVGYGQ